jgi:hypothetical protein
MSEYDAALRELAGLWDRHDPVPADLVEKVLVAIEIDDVDHEYEMLHLVERSRKLAGTRSTGEAMTVSFAIGEFALMLRVSPNGHGTCRVDGWVTPAQTMQVKVTQQEHTVQTQIDARGRFELTGLPKGLTRFWLYSEGGGDDEESRLFSTPIVEL